MGLKPNGLILPPCTGEKSQEWTLEGDTIKNEYLKKCLHSSLSEKVDRLYDCGHAETVQMKVVDKTVVDKAGKCLVRGTRAVVFEPCDKPGIKKMIVE
jgi:hypothetical protein